MATKSALCFSLWVMEAWFGDDFKRYPIEAEGFATLTPQIFILLEILHF